MELESRIEAIIFLSKEKISVDELVNHFKIDKQKKKEKKRIGTFFLEQLAFYKKVHKPKTFN